MLAFVKALFVEEHKKKMKEDAKIFILAGKLSDEIPNEVIMEYLKTLSIEEEQRQSVDKTTIMEVNGKPVPKVVMLNQYMHSLNNRLRMFGWKNQRDFNLQENLQHKLSLDATKRQAEIYVAIVPNNMDSTERETLEEGMLQSVIKASLME